MQQVVVVVQLPNRENKQTVKKIDGYIIMNLYSIAVDFLYKIILLFFFFLLRDPSYIFFFFFLFNIHNRYGIFIFLYARVSLSFCSSQKKRDRKTETRKMFVLLFKYIKIITIVDINQIMISISQENVYFQTNRNRHYL